MSGLAHHFENAGISTVTVGLVPQHVRAMKPPRALLVPFELGRPLGPPGDAAVQAQVMSAALALLDQPGPGPVVQAFEHAAPTGTAESTWVCPVSFPAPQGKQTPATQLQAEVDLLRPWFDRGRQQRGRTATGTSGLDIDAICTWLPAFASDTTPELPVESEHSLPDTFKLAVEDLKAYYLEAATSQPGDSTPTELRNWLYGETAAGALLEDLRTRLAQHADPGMRVYAGFTLVPQAFLARAG